MKITDEEWRIIIQEFLASAEHRITTYSPRCEISGRCCRFKEYDHTLFLSQVEADILLKDGLPEASKTSVEENGEENLAVSPDTCPFQINGLCTAREKRPLGCRTFFCDPQYQDTMPVVTEELLTELKELHLKYDRTWSYAPLYTYLNSYQQKSIR